MNNSHYRPSAPSPNQNSMYPQQQQQQPQGFYPGPQQPHYPSQQPNIGGAVAAGVVGGMVAGAMMSSHQPHFPPPHHHQPHFVPQHHHHHHQVYTRMAKACFLNCCQVFQVMYIKTKDF